LRLPPELSELLVTMSGAISAPLKHMNPADHWLVPVLAILKEVVAVV